MTRPFDWPPVLRRCLEEAAHTASLNNKEEYQLTPYRGKGDFIAVFDGQAVRHYAIRPKVKR